MNKDTIFLGLGAGLTAYAMFLAKGNKIFGVDKKMITFAGIGLLAYGGYSKFIKNRAPPPMPMPLPAPMPAAPGGAGGATPIAAGPIAPIPIGGGGAPPSGMPIIPTNTSDANTAAFGNSMGGNFYNDLL